VSLDPQDIAELDRHIEGETFQGLLQKWQTLIASLDGYAFSIYDYDNDVTVRERIKQAIDQSPVDVQVKAWAELKPLDEAFLAKTAPAKRTAFSHQDWPSRIPLHPGEDLAKDIEDQSL
jgi:hypothetical protein